MSEKSDRALELFSSGCNCCQAVVGVFCDGYGIPMETVLRLGAAFGGGMRKQEVCGAVAGALMALGMKYGPTGVGDKEAKEAKATANAKTVEFMDEFVKRHGSYLCRDLQGVKCKGLVAGAVEQAEEFKA